MDTENRICFECGEKGSFEKIEKTVEVEVKEITLINDHIYYECQKCGELYEPLEDVDRNLLSDYALYHKIKSIDI